MTKKELALETVARLKKEYPDAGCTLEYEDAWKLLISVRLAAQCTDARVNIVVKDLFAKYPSPAALAAATPEEIEEEAMRRDEKADSISQYLDKQKRVKKEVARLKRLFKEIVENKKKLVFATIDDVAFMSITMQDLRENIIRDGTTVEYKNGENQYGTKQSPDAQLYLQFSQKQTQAMKILQDCLPKTKAVEVVEKDDGFDEFVGGREDV